MLDLNANNSPRVRSSSAASFENQNEDGGALLSSLAEATRHPEPTTRLTSMQAPKRPASPSTATYAGEAKEEGGNTADPPLQVVDLTSPEPSLPRAPSRSAVANVPTPTDVSAQMAETFQSRFDSLDAKMDVLMDFMTKHLAAIEQASIERAASGRDSTH